MITMDAKGIKWVGNIYQKFEAMCLEVEEIMYQDTVKYVEDQVQNVGATVKRFYSDVVQDFTPPSSEDPVKVPASELPVERYSDVGIYRRRKVGMKKDPLRVDVGKQAEDSKVISGMNKNVGCARSLHAVRDVDNLCQLSSGDSVKGTYSEAFSGHYRDGNIYNKSNLGIQEIPENDKLPQTEMSGEIAPINDVGRASSELSNQNQGASCDQTVTVSAPALVEVGRFDSIAESCNEVENASEHINDDSMHSASSDMPFLVDSVGNEGKEMRPPSSDGLSAESNAADICTNNGAISLFGSSLDLVQYNEVADKEGFVSHPGRSDDWSLEALESSTVSERGVETTQQDAKVKLEETCILVDGDELHFVPHKEGKRRPYKKKIQEAFSSRMRSARKHEYEQLAVWHGSDGKISKASAESSTPTLPLVNRKKTTTNDFNETEWELL
ncbi:hypothetical protein RGQ29_028036 [Quercus rubra]|uniref:Uncharacterized protein n=1 Tax=Quercus rubra TaxID=3512 RepID=A0AAN7ER28_QUERU|nr:hypothetical protein RGQ29_028036 [Quercus rubra]